MEAGISYFLMGSQLDFRLLVEKELYLPSSFHFYFQVNCKISLPMAVVGL